MQFANNESGLRTYIRDAQENGEYSCPYCDAPMIQRRGKVNIPHFAHRKGYCTDDWKYDDYNNEMSEWHLSWQSRYPLENQEICVSSPMGRHRADVLIHDTVIEFQHSPMSPEEFQKRNDFYTACGYRVIWLFDAREAYRSNLTEDRWNRNKAYCWKHPPKTLTGFDPYGKVQVFFHLLDETQEESSFIVRLIQCKDGDLSSFASAPSQFYTNEQFVELTSTGTVRRETDTSGKEKLFHSLYLVNRKNGWPEKLEYFGCPISRDGYAPQNHEDGRTACRECTYCKELNNDNNVATVKCSGRYRAYLDQIETVLEEQSRSLTFIAKDGSIRKAEIELPDSPLATLLELAERRDGILFVQNVANGCKFMIERDVNRMLQDYDTVYGRIWCPQRNTWGSSKEIYYKWKRQWIMVGV